MAELFCFPSGRLLRATPSPAPVPVTDAVIGTSFPVLVLGFIVGVLLTATLLRGG